MNTLSIRIALALSIATLAGCAATVDTTPAPEGERVGTEAARDLSPTEKSAEQRNTFKTVDGVTQVDPSTGPDQIWNAYVICDRPPIACSCTFDAGPVKWVYASVNTCQCEAYAHKKGTLTVTATCDGTP